MQNYKDLEKNIEKDFSSVSSLETLQEFRLSYLGKKGKISLLMKELSSLDADQRKENAEQPVSYTHLTLPTTSAV